MAAATADADVPVAVVAALGDGDDRVDLERVPRLARLPAILARSPARRFARLWDAGEGRACELGDGSRG